MGARRRLPPFLCAEIERGPLEDARELTGLREPDVIADFYLRLGARIIALTLGREGALIATPDARRRVASTTSRR